MGCELAAACIHQINWLNSCNGCARMIVQLTSSVIIIIIIIIITII